MLQQHFDWKERKKSHEKMEHLFVSFLYFLILSHSLTHFVEDGASHIKFIFIPLKSEAVFLKRD
jgi:hypothetical protein